MKWIVTSLVFIVIFLFLTGFLNRKTDLHENMVNASVRLINHGSGVFIEDDIILTAAHCLEDVKTIGIKLRDGTLLKSSDFYIDDEEDVAFIFVDVDEICIAKISSRSMKIGDTIFLVGRPFNDLFEFTLTKGIVSHLDRDEPEWNWNDLLQVDAEGGPGSSGGPLYDSDGNLVGMYVGHSDGGGQGITLCETTKSILEAYERCMELRDAPN